MNVGKVFPETYSEVTGTIEFEFYPEALEVSPLELTRRIDEILRVEGFEISWEDDTSHKVHIVNIGSIHDNIEHCRHFANGQRATAKVRKIQK